MFLSKELDIIGPFLSILVEYSLSKVSCWTLQISGAYYNTKVGGGLNLECNAVYPFNSNKPDLTKEHQLKQLSSITAHFSAFPVLTHLTQLTEDGLN